LGGKRALLEQVVEWRPDVVHLHGIAALSAARTIAKDLEVPVLISVDDAVAPAKAKPLADTFVSWVLVPTEAHRAHYVGRAKLARDCVAQLPFAFDYEQLIAESARDARDPQAPPVIGLFLRDGDNIDDLLKLLDTVATAGSAFSCIVAHSDDIDGEALKERILSDANRPWCSLMDLANTGFLLPHIDIFLQPNSERRVAPIIKAMGVGRAVLAIADVGIDEIIRHDETGLVVLPNDADGLRVAVSNLLTDAGLRERLGTAAQADARARFAIDIVGTALVELYRNAISAIHHPENKSEGSRAYRRQITH
jgi:glycosyltransferase involved in cell wall biosynthesis